MRKRAHEIPEGWSVDESDFVVHFGPSDGRGLRQPSVFVAMRNGPAAAPRDALPGIRARLRALPGYRRVPAGRSPFRGARLFAYAFGAPRSEAVVRAHLFAAGGRSFTVIAQAPQLGWADGTLLAAVRLIEADMARESREEPAEG